MQAHWLLLATLLSTLVPVLPLVSLRRTFAETFATPAVERTRNERRETDRRGGGDRRKLRAHWPDRLERRQEHRRGSDQREAARTSANTVACGTAATPLRKGLIVDVYA